MIEIKLPLTCLKEMNKVILRNEDDNYIFGCDPIFWNFPDSFKLCRLIGSQVEWIVDNPSTNHGLILNTLRDKVFTNLKGRVLLSGGHYIPNLRNIDHFGEGPIKTTQMSMMVIDDLTKIGFNNFGFLVLADDLYMAYDYVNLKPESVNYYRERLFKPPLLPKMLVETINNYQGVDKLKFNLYFSTEKTLADRFKRHIKTAKYRNSDHFIRGDNFPDHSQNDWFFLVEGTPIQVLANNKPTCQAAIAALLRDIELIVINKKIKPNFQSFIGFFPLCSTNNVVEGLKLAGSFYNTKLITYIVFTTTKCF